jgi:predicted esterase
MFGSFPGCYVVAVDFPGFGRTPGERFSSRTEHFDQPGQTTEFMDRLFKLLKISPTRKVILAGYDYGGNVALHLSLHKKLSQSISRLVLFHPNYTQPVSNLSSIKQPVLLFWVKSDVMHLVKEGQKMTKTIANCKMYSIKVSKDRQSGYYDFLGGWVGPVVKEELFPSRVGEVSKIDRVVDPEAL